jgi:nucleoid-associated protein EbfC
MLIGPRLALQLCRTLWRLHPVFGIKDLLQQAQGLQAKVTALQEELAEKTVTGSAGGDMVQVTANGAQEIVAIKIEKELLSPDDPEFLEDLIVAAANDALKKSKELMTQEMSKLTGGLRIPGLT